MRRTLTLVALTTALSMGAFAADWSGTLLDATCYDRQQQQKAPEAAAADACLATSTTVTFSLEVSGKVYKLDSAGNSKAVTALKNRADRTAPGQKQPTRIMAKVMGTETGGTIKVEEIDLQ